MIHIGRSRTLRGVFLSSMAMLLALGILVSCEGQKRETPRNEKAGNSGAERLGTESGGTVRIAGIVFQEDQFFRMIELGMRDAASKSGIELMVGNSFGSIDKEISLIDSYIAGQVAAIVISPLSRKASAPALERATGAGIRVITYNTTIDSFAPSSYIESDQFDLGASTAKAVHTYITEKLHGAAKIAMIEFMSQAPEQASLRVQGFKSVIGNIPGVRIVAEQDAWLVQQAADVVEQIITAHPDVNIIWAANEGGTVGAAIAVKNAGRAGRIMVFGTDMSEQIADFLLSEDDILQGVTGQKPFEIGAFAVQNALKVVHGEAVKKSISIPGILFTRSRPDEIKNYLSALKQLSR